MTSIEVIERLKQELAASGDGAAGGKTRGQRVMDVAIAYGQAIGDTRTPSTYDQGEKLLAAWKEFLDAHEQELSADQRCYAVGRLHNAAGHYWESRANYAYYVEADF